MRILLVAIYCFLSYAATAAPQDYWPDRVQYFISEEVSQRDIRIAQRFVRNAEFSIYDLSGVDKVNQDLQNSVPKRVVEQGEKATEAYIKEYVVPMASERVNEVLESKVGIAMAKVYGVERLPAVVLDGKYITYGLSVSDSVKAYQRWRDTYE
ncbi:DUF1525 domain-containing protein [Vibrio mediterranei]|uniref:DUF1525 domain-containing protein n=1 Tax=Vibrio mediterranei TaxID=689 RepID=UPI004067C525